MRIASAVILALLPVMGVAFTPSVRSLGVAVVCTSNRVTLLIGSDRIGFEMILESKQQSATSKQLTLDLFRH